MACWNESIRRSDEVTTANVPFVVIGFAFTIAMKAGKANIATTYPV
jgi:ABC-type uncharacterized transport system permease subunit